MSDDKIEILTRHQLDADAAEHMEPGDNVLGLNPGCDGAAFRVAYHPETSTILLTCSKCDAPVVAVLVGNEPRTVDDGANLVSLGAWQDGHVPSDQSAATTKAVKSQLATLYAMGEEVRANVVASVLLSTLMMYADPVDSLARLAEQVGARLPDMIAQRELLQREPQGQA